MEYCTRYSVHPHILSFSDTALVKKYIDDFLKKHPCLKENMDLQV